MGKLPSPVNSRGSSTIQRDLSCRDSQASYDLKWVRSNVFARTETRSRNLGITCLRMRRGGNGGTNNAQGLHKRDTLKHLPGWIELSCRPPAPNQHRLGARTSG